MTHPFATVAIAAVHNTTQARRGVRVLRRRRGRRYQMVTNIVGCAVDDVRTDLAVEVTFHDAGALTLPYFQPA